MEDKKISNNIDIGFYGIKQSNSIQCYVSNKIKKALKKIALKGFCKMIVIRNESHIKVVATLISPGRKYVVVATGSSLDEVLKKILLQIKKRFQKIKTPRIYWKFDEFKYSQFQQSSQGGEHV